MVCTILSDIFGRKPIFLLSQWAMVVIGVANAFAPNYLVFTVLKFFSGVLAQVCSPANSFLCFSFFLLINNQMRFTPMHTVTEEELSKL